MKSMKNRVLLGVLVFTGLIAGLLLSWQFSTEVPLESSFATDSVQAREDLIKKFLDEQSYLQSRIVTLRKQIEDDQDKIEVQTESINLEFLESLKAKVGLTEVTGSGIQITLNDSPLALREGPEVSDQNRVQASDIRDIVNILNAASAEAISVNDQRVVANTPISAVGTTILINNSHVAPPFNILVVGDSELILERLLNKNLLPLIYQKKLKSKVIFEITRKNRITVPIYNGDFQVNYLNLVE